MRSPSTHALPTTPVPRRPSTLPMASRSNPPISCWHRATICFCSSRTNMGGPPPTPPSSTPRPTANTAPMTTGSSFLRASSPARILTSRSSAPAYGHGGAGWRPIGPRSCCASPQGASSSGRFSPTARSTTTMWWPAGPGSTLVVARSPMVLPAGTPINDSSGPMGSSPDSTVSRSAYPAPRPCAARSSRSVPVRKSKSPRWCQTGASPSPGGFSMRRPFKRYLGPA